LLVKQAVSWSNCQHKALKFTGLTFFNLLQNPASNTFDITFSGRKAGSGDSYIAIAFGLTQNMQDADLYYCNGTELKSGSIKSLRNPPSIDSTLPVGSSQELFSYT